MRKIALLLSLALLLAAPALAESKIGIVDIQKAVAKSDAGQQVKARLDKELSAFRKELESRKSELEKLRDEIGKQSEVMKDDALAEKKRSFDQKVRDAQRFEEDRGRELQTLDQTMYNQLLQKFIKLAYDVSKQEGYDFVFERSSMIYAVDAADFTDKLIAEANKSIKP